MMNYQDQSASRGPVSSMPGSSHKVALRAKCDKHEDRPAVKRIQGETDSFGCEYIHMCDECFAAYQAAKDKLGGADHIGNCSCGNVQVPLFALRDYDEGSAGPLYYKCEHCRREWLKREAEEIENYYAESDDSDYYDDSDYDDSDYDDSDYYGHGD